MWDLIVSVPDHCVSLYLGLIHFVLGACNRVEYHIVCLGRVRTDTNCVRSM